MFERALVLCVLAALPHVASASTQDLLDMADALSTEIATIPAIRADIKKASAAHRGLAEADLIARDDDWRAEIGKSDRPLINGVIDSAGSEALRDMVARSGGMVTEIIVMDGRGMNAAISSVTSDYWQGDEAKFTETYPNGSEGTFVDEVEYDESTGTYQIQVSRTLTDEATGRPIGAVTFGFDATAF